MVSLSEAREAPARQLWDEVNSVHAGMLGLEGLQNHMQPMAPHADPKTNTIWFYSKKDSQLVQSLKSGARAHFCVIGKDHDYHACLSGKLEVRDDKTKVEEYWNSVTAAWYEHGKSDPLLTMLALHVENAEIWASTDSTLKFGWEIAKANMSDDKTPDIGVRQHLTFA